MLGDCEEAGVCVALPEAVQPPLPPPLLTEADGEVLALAAAAPVAERVGEPLAVHVTETEAECEEKDEADGEGDAAPHNPFAHVKICVNAFVSARLESTSALAPSSCSDCVVARSAQPGVTQSHSYKKVLGRLVKTTDANIAGAASVTDQNSAAEVPSEP